MNGVFNMKKYPFDSFPLIIGFSGKKHSGKDTCAKVIADEVFEMTSGLLDTRTYAYAGPMKRLCMQFFGLTHEQCYGTDERKNSLTALWWKDFPVPSCITEENKHRQMTAREVLQFFGTEIIRKLDTNAHVNALMWDIEHQNPRIGLIVDVRFPNEVSAIQKRGGKVIRLTRCLYPNDKHASETSLDPENFDWGKFDYILDNRELSVSEQQVTLLALAKKWNITGETI